MLYQIADFKKQVFSRKIGTSQASKHLKCRSVSKQKSKSQTKCQPNKIKILFDNNIKMPLKSMLKSKKQIQIDSPNANKLVLPTLQKNVNRLKLSNYINKAKISNQASILEQNFQKKTFSPFKLLIQPVLSNLKHRQPQQTGNIRKSLDVFSVSDQIQNRIIQQKQETKQYLFKTSQSQSVLNDFSSSFFNLNTNLSTNLYKASGFKLCSTFSIAINYKVQKKNCYSQTQNIHEKYYDDFLKFKDIFNSSFGKIERIVQQFDNQILQKAIDQKSIEQLLVNTFTEFNIQRQRRVTVLDIQIEQASKAAIAIFSKLKRQEEFQYQSEKNKKYLMIGSVPSNHHSSNYQLIKDFQNKFNEWRSLIYENKFLIYNCVKQLQKIPELLLTIFKRDKDSMKINQSSTEQQKIREFLKIKCLKCFQTNRNISFLQQKCQKTFPVIKALENLLKDPKRLSFFGIK